MNAADILVLIEEENKARSKGESSPQRRDFLVVEHELPQLRQKLDAMVRRAAKLGLDPISYRVGDYVDTPVKRDGREYVVRRFALHIDGVTPKLAGWTFAATLQHLDGGDNIVRSISDVQVPVEYRSVASSCDHCKKTRNRNDTFVLYHAETKIWKQIGSSCIADFLGSVQADVLARQAEYLWKAIELAEGSEDEGGFGSRVKARYGLLEVLTLTAGAIEQFGWLSKKKARELAGM